MTYPKSAFAAFMLAGFMLSPALAETQNSLSVPQTIDLMPLPKPPLEHDSNPHRRLDDNLTGPVATPRAQNSLERAGIDPDIDASATGVGVSQKIGLGSQELPEERGTLQPYLELGAHAEKHDDSPVLSRNGLDSDINATIGGGTSVSVTDNIDLHLGYTRRAPVGSVPAQADEEDKVESGVSIRF